MRFLAFHKLFGFALTCLMYSPGIAWVSDFDHDKVVAAPQPLPLYNWSGQLKLTFDPRGDQGAQVLHFSSNKCRPYQDDEAATEFVKTYCEEAKQFDTDADTLRFASDSVILSGGAYLEMGTGSGRTANFIAGLNPKQTLYTFDSFLGLPEKWQKGSRTLAQGSFAALNPDFVPAVLNNVKVYKGLFKDVLPGFKHHILKDGPIALLNIDSDIYSASRDVFTALGANIVPGTVIHLDECYNYPHYKHEEWQAFLEFIETQKLSFKVIGFNAIHEQVVVKIL